MVTANASRERIAYVECLELSKVAIVRVERSYAVLEEECSDMRIGHEISAHRDVGGHMLLSLLPIHDRLSQGRIHPVSLWGGIVSFAWGFLFFRLIRPTSAWHAFAAWIVGSP